MSNRARVKKPRYLDDQSMAATFNAPWLNIEGVDNFSFQAKWIKNTRVITANGTTDHVVSGTKTWTFASGAFTSADVGATFVVANSVADNGTYTVASVTNGTTIVSTEAVTADETFGATVTATITQVGPTGTFTVEGSNDGPLEDESTRRVGPTGNLGGTTIATATTNPAVAAGTSIVAVTARSEVWARLVYTRASGWGSLDVGFAGKGV